MFSLAKETNWTEDFILDMPLGKLYGYRHALLRSYDASTHHLTTEEEKKELFELFNSL